MDEHDVLEKPFSTVATNLGNPLECERHDKSCRESIMPDSPNSRTLIAEQFFGVNSPMGEKETKLGPIDQERISTILTELRVFTGAAP